MEFVVIGIFIIGSLINTFGYLWLLVEAFRKHPLWGLGCLLFPPTAFVFFICHFKRTWKPCCLAMLGGAVILIAAMLMPPLPPG